MSRGPLPARTLLAICERHGYRREQAAELSRAYVVDVLQHETDDRGGLVVPPAPGEAAGPRTAADETRQRLKRWRVPPWLIEREVAAEQARQSAHTRRRPRRG